MNSWVCSEASFRIGKAGRLHGLPSAVGDVAAQSLPFDGAEADGRPVRTDGSGSAAPGLKPSTDTEVRPPRPDMVPVSGCGSNDNNDLRLQTVEARNWHGFEPVAVHGKAGKPVEPATLSCLDRSGYAQIAGTEMPSAPILQSTGAWPRTPRPGSTSEWCDEGVLRRAVRQGLRGHGPLRSCSGRSGSSAGVRSKTSMPRLNQGMNADWSNRRCALQFHLAGGDATGSGRLRFTCPQSLFLPAPQRS